MAIGTNGKIGIGLSISAILLTGLFFVVYKIQKENIQDKVAANNGPVFKGPKGSEETINGGSRRRRKSKKRK